VRLGLCRKAAYSPDSVRFSEVPVFFRRILRSNLEIFKQRARDAFFGLTFKIGNVTRQGDEMAEGTTPEGPKAPTPPPTPPVAAPVEKASGKAVASLVLGIIGVLCCGLLAPVAWILAAQERKAIEEGKSPAAGSGLATAGFILGIIGTVLLILVIVIFFIQLLIGGLSILPAILNP